MTGAIPDDSGPLFLDALDEYRVDGSPADKAYGLASAIQATGADQWRISCRSEDWRKAADIEPIKQTTRGTDIVVAQLLRLDEDEAVAILANSGEERPQEFLQKAVRLGALAFTESPLSLTLLHKAVAERASWPPNRFSLFLAAVKRLAFERNAEHRRKDRRSPDEILRAAEDVCLVLLASGSRAVWRAHDEPPDGKDERAFVTSHELGVHYDLLTDVLDTALFRGEGDAFEPMHRAVAEFLAGQSLARAVRGENGRAALPLMRALAMITGDDGKPPTELRGLFAWFAAHLAQLGEAQGADRLIQTDALSILAYGDAAAFDTDSRRAILQNLDRDDPYFRMSDRGLTALGGLAGEDLALDFRRVLLDGADGSHRFITIMDALTTGSPVQSLRPLLREIALDAGRSLWERSRALEAWLNGAEDPATAQRGVFDELTAQPLTRAREVLRANLAADLPDTLLPVADIRGVISGFNVTREDNTIGYLWRLQRRLEREPRPDLFDLSITDWLERSEDGRVSLEVGSLLDHALGAAIAGTPNLDAKRLLTWSRNRRLATYSNQDEETRGAVTKWLDAVPGRDVALFGEIVAQADPNEGAWIPANTYTQVTHRTPTPSMVHYILDQARRTRDRNLSKRMYEIAVNLGHRSDLDPNAYWSIYNALAGERGRKRLLAQLTTVPIPTWKRQEYGYARKRKRKKEVERRKNIEALAPIREEMAAGVRTGPLTWAANHYLQDSNGPRDRASRLARIRSLVDESTAEAIFQGWENIALSEQQAFDAAHLGRLEANNQYNTLEYTALVGLIGLTSDDRLPALHDIPLTLALVALRQVWVFPEDQRREFQQWAARRLDADLDLGTAALLQYAGAVLDSGGTRLDAFLRLEDEQCHSLSSAIEQLLAERPTAPAETLDFLLRLAASRLPRALLADYSAMALDLPSLTDSQRRIWTFIAYATNPQKYTDAFIASHRDEAAIDLFDQDVDRGLMGAYAPHDPDTWARREELVIVILGARYVPVDFIGDEDDEGGITRNRRMSERIRRSIDWLSRMPGTEAGRVLARLADEASLAAWRATIRHAVAVQARIQRDQTYAYAPPQALRSALSGGPPANGADLAAVVKEELLRVRDGLHAADVTPWKHFWNTDSAGKPETPKVENQCRDILLDKLRPRLGTYHIAGAFPEGRQAEERRADLLVLTGAGKSLPVEIKRHFHPNLWSAPAAQLQGYVSSSGSAGRGIYLVFWFGTAVRKTPTRRDRKVPQSASELEAMLRADLSPQHEKQIDVIVLNVSPPG